MKIKKGLFFFILLTYQIHLNCTFHVCTDQSLVQSEIDYLKTRENEIVKESFKRYLNNTEIKKFPRIAFCLSGGGFRAMISGLGILAGAQQIGLFDCASYMSGLSGGTWAILPLILRGVDPLGYANILKNRICNPAINKDTIISKLIEQTHSNSKFKLVDFWGNFVGEKLFGDISKDRYISFNDIRKILREIYYLPFPICSSVIGQTAPNYEWLEVSPFETYSNYLGGSIPTCSLGCKFNAGVSSDPIREKSLEFFIGLFGSAFCLTLGDGLSKTLEDFLDYINLDLIGKQSPGDYYTRLLDRFNKIFKKLKIYRERLFPAKIPNFTFNMPGAKMSNIENLELIDAGYNFNLPIPPLLRQDRNIDIFVVCDASSDAGDYDSTQLLFAKKYAEKIGKKFPNLSKFKSNSPNLKIFYSEDPETPIVIYFANSINFSTLKMFYTPEEFYELFGTAFKTIADSNNLIIEAIKKKANIYPNNFDSIPDTEIQSCNCIIC